MRSHRGEAVGARAGWPAVRAWLLGVMLVAVMTAPTVTRPASVGRLDTNDGRFSIWTVAWVAHAILSPEATILDANIFYPHTGTLAYSELNLVAGLFALPWYAATGSSLAALNGAVFAALVLAFISMWALVRRLTMSDPAGLVAATAFTFCPFTSSHTPHIQLLMVFVFPLVLLALHRHVERPGVWRGVVLGGAVALAALACGYYGVFAGSALALMSILLARRSRAYWAGLAAAAATAAALVGPVFFLFMRARAASGAPLRAQTLEAAREYSANGAAWLASGAAAHQWWLPRLAAWQKWSEVLFPGLALLALATLGLAALRAPASRRTVGAYIALGMLAFWATFGPGAWLYSALYHFVPGASLIRAPSRAGIVVVCALAVVAGYAVTRLAETRRWLPWALVILVAAESGVKTAEWGWPSWPLRRSPPVSPAYTFLAQAPRGVLVEYQFPYVSSNYHNHATAMYWSTYHWQRLVNGYSDLIPPDFEQIALPINGFPDATSFEIMKARNVRYVLWHIDYYRGEGERIIRQRLDRYASYLRPLVRTEDVWLYEITAWP